MIEIADRAELVVLPELGGLDRAAHDSNRFVVDLERNRKGVTVFSAVSKGEARRIGEAARRTVDDFGHLSQRANRSRADAWRDQKVGKISRATLGRGGESTVKRRMTTSFDVIS